MYISISMTLCHNNNCNTPFHPSDDRYLFFLVYLFLKSVSIKIVSVLDRMFKIKGNEVCIDSSIRCLQFTHKVLGLDPQLSYKGLAEAHVCKPRTMGLRQEDLWVLLVSQPDRIREIRFSERAHLKN